MPVLVIEDSVAVRTRLVALLGEAGFVVGGEAGDAGTALVLARSARHEAIVLDLSLPDRSGLEILPELRTLAPDARIVVLSNQPRIPYEQRCLALGADVFLDKSSGFDQVAAFLSEGRTPGGEGAV